MTVLDKSGRLDAIADPEAEKAAREALRQAFTIHLGVDVESVMEAGKARLNWSGDSAGSITADMVLAATGRIPSLEGLNLAAAGVEMDDNGVPRFDPDTRRCGDSQVFVAGDAGAWRPVLHEAARGGRTPGA